MDTLRARPDTVARVDTIVRRDTVIRVDTLPAVPPDTVKIVRVDTVISRPDTVFVPAPVDHTPRWVCVAAMGHDTLYALNPRNGPFCDAHHLAPQFPQANVLVDVDPALAPMSAAPQRATLILPSWRATH